MKRKGAPAFAGAPLSYFETLWIAQGTEGVGLLLAPEDTQCPQGQSLHLIFSRDDHHPAQVVQLSLIHI